MISTFQTSGMPCFFSLEPRRGKGNLNSSKDRGLTVPTTDEVMVSGNSFSALSGYYVEMITSRHAEILMCEYLIVNVDELAGIMKSPANVEKFKAMASTPKKLCA